MNGDDEVTGDQVFDGEDFGPVAVCIVDLQHRIAAGKSGQRIPIGTLRVLQGAILPVAGVEATIMTRLESQGQVEVGGIVPLKGNNQLCIH